MRDEYEDVVVWVITGYSIFLALWGMAVAFEIFSHWNMQLRCFWNSGKGRTKFLISYGELSIIKNAK
jgi:hypothetical protein